MNLRFYRHWLVFFTGLILATNWALAQDADSSTNNVPAPITRAEMTQNYLRIQEQIHETQLAIQQTQAMADEAAKKNTDALAAKLESLEQSVAAQHANDTEAARKSQQLTLLIAGAFGLAGLGVMLLMVYFQWRAFTHLAQLSSQQHPAIAGVNGSVHELAAPGRVTVETSNARLLDVVGQLEKRIQELEGGQRLLPEIQVEQPIDSLTDAQKQLDANQPQKALDILEKYLAKHPDNAHALVKKAVSLEKLGRNSEALSCCDRAIAADGTLAIAHLHKGGLLNRLRRYDEALDCYERALLAQEKGPAAKAV